MARQRIRGERGSILIISVVLATAMLLVAVASFSFVDSQQARGKEQRQRETSLNLTEAVLNSQGFALAQTWPGNVAGGAAMPTTCTSASVQSLCPNPNTLAAGNSSAPGSANFTSPDASADVTWETRIRDNGAPNSDAFDFSKVDLAQSGTNVVTGAAYTCPGPCKWDANGDLKLWVQARGSVSGQRRNLVSLLKREQFGEAFARNTVTTGSFETTNNGNKTIIDASGSQVLTRCLGNAPACTKYEGANASDKKEQVSPEPIVQVANYPAGMTATQLARFKASAQSASPSTYFTSCPGTLTGRVVFIDVPTATQCTDSNNATYNSATAPGVVIMPRGTLAMKGTLHGLIYMVNEQNSSSAVLTLQANSQVRGGVSIDGPGRLVAGQASGNSATIVFDPNAFNSLTSYGTTGLVQNTWRELPPS